MSNSYHIKYTEIGHGKPVVHKAFVTCAEVKRFISTNKHKIADMVVYDLLNSKIITDQFRSLLK